MTPKQKAKELIETYLNMNDGLIQEFIPIPIEGARQCALIAVDEVLKECSWEQTGFWMSVKQEIENL
jgi:glutathione synthase/RimK-type ligase-like ATP-grasp enzyme